jgi:hypothetical protein
VAIALEYQRNGNSISTLGKLQQQWHISKSGNSNGILGNLQQHWQISKVATAMAS